MGGDRQAPAGWHDSVDFKWFPPAKGSPSSTAAAARAPPGSGSHETIERQFVAVVVQSPALREPILAALDAGKETLTEFAGEWWELHAFTLAKATQESYATMANLSLFNYLK